MPALKKSIYCFNLISEFITLQTIFKNFDLTKRNTDPHKSVQLPDAIACNQIFGL